MNTNSHDALVIGTGIAGLCSAIKLAEAGLDVCIVTREEAPEVANTYYAQGGIAYTKGGNLSLVEDIQKASAGTSSSSAAELMSKRSEDILNEILLEKAKTDFEKDEKGALKYTKEAAHSMARIVYKGDYTGKEIEISLLNYINNKEQFPNVTFLTGHTAIDLLTPAHHGNRIQQRYEEEKVVGAYVLNQATGVIKKIIAKTTLLATGGVGALYLHHSNAEGTRGDGHAMARRAGAILTNMEFVQFHPTTFFDRSGHRRFLISEAVRGEGGILKNAMDEAFMAKYHPDKELAPRDVVARAIQAEMINSNHDCVYLDISHKDDTWIINRFPTIHAHCLDNDIDITKRAIPVVPAAHYTCGGIKTDLKARTNIKNLYAAGEVACTGLHGANRLASTALLEGLVMGYVAAEDIISNIASIDSYAAETIRDWENIGSSEADQALIQQDWLTLKQTMWNYVGLIRTTTRLTRANAMFRELFDEIQRFYKNTEINDEIVGLRNAVETCLMVLGASMLNKRSAGCFYRED